MKQFLLYILPVFLLAFLWVNFYWENPKFSSKDDELLHYTLSNDYQTTSSLYHDLLQSDSLNVDYHYNFLTAYFNIEITNKYWLTNPVILSASEVINQYKKYCVSDDPKLQNIGYLGLAICYFELKLFDECFYELQKISDPEFPYLNLLFAGFYHLTDYQQSLNYYLKELKINSSPVVYDRIADLMVYHQKPGTLMEFLNDPKAEQNVSIYYKRFAYFHKVNILEYTKTIVERVWKGINFFGVLGAVFIALVWLIYLLKIHSNPVRSYLLMILLFLLGSGFALFTSILTDIFRFSFGFKVNGTLLNDLFYMIVGIGVVEEGVKILPFLLILFFSNKIKEPIDFLIYASLSALGFAFLENIIYFDHSGIKTIQGRALTAAVIHLFCTSLIAYGIVIGKFSKKRNTLLYFLLFFILSSFVHGLYDFWLLSPLANHYSFVTFLILLTAMVIWTSMNNNCLNNSESAKFWDYQPEKINHFLLFSLSFIFLFQYLLVGWKFGATVANFQLQKDLVAGLFLLIFLTINLSKFDYIPNYWAPLKFWDWDVFLNIPRIKPIYFNLKDIVGSKILLTSNKKFGLLQKKLPLSGIIISRELISWEKDWYLIHLDQTFKLGKNEYQYVLIKVKSSNEIIFETSLQLVQVRLVKNLDLLKQRKKLKKDFLLMDVAFLSKKTS